MKTALILLISICTLGIGCGNMRDFLTKRQSIVVRKLNKTLTIPAFSVESGPVRSCLRNAAYIHVTPPFAEFLNAVTMEAWVNPENVLSPFVVFSRYDSISEVTQYHLNIQANKTIGCSFRKGAADITATSTQAIPEGEWSFVSVTWDGTTVRFFINGIDAGGSFALAAPLDSVGGTIEHSLIASGAMVDEVRLWNEGRAGTLGPGNVSDIILGSMNHPRNIVAADGVDDNLKAYYKFDDLTDSISGEAIIYSSGLEDLHTEDGAPINFGMSWIVKLFTITNTQKCSIHRNFVRPTNPNHGLYVSWEDDDGNLQRRRLYGAEPDDVFGVEIIHPTPEDYDGETLPEIFNLEFWNIDGLESTDLEEDLILKTSVTNLHSSHREHTETALSTPVGTSTLYDAFPLGNPITRETEQFL